MLTLLNLGRWSLLDLPRLLRPTDPAPKPESTTLPLVRLKRLADEHGLEVYDFRGFDRTAHYDPREWGWFRDEDPKRNLPARGRARGRRAWESITAVMLHRTGVDMGPHRFLGTPCHDAVARDGSIVLCHPHDAYLPHGHRANRFSVGLEVSSADGRITGRQGVAADILLEYVIDDLLEHRPGVPDLMPHRFSHRSRKVDPGRRIWNRVAVPLILERSLGLGPVVGSGRPLPLPGEPW